MVTCATLAWDRIRRAALFGAFVLVLTGGTAWAQTGALTNLTVANLSPAFSPTVTQYTIPRTSACSVSVSAMLANTAHRMYIASAETASGGTRSVWVCDGVTKFSIVIYQNWTEVGRYTVTLVNAPPPPPPAPMTYLTALNVAGLSPAFSPSTTQYTLQRTSACSVPVSATLTNSSHKLYIGGNEVASGATSNAWVCDGRTKIDVIVYQVWTEKARYTITMVDPPAPPPAPPTTPTTPTMPPATPTTPTPPPTPPSFEPAPEPSPLPGLWSDPLPPAVSVSASVAERILQQASFGPTQALMNEVKAIGVERWLALQMQIPVTPIADGMDTNGVSNAVLLKMANGPDQLRQRVAFALGQTLVVSTNKLVNGYELTPWVRLIENHVFGNYRSILRDVTLSPSMGKFLDLANSQGTNGNAPNENYPRELLQLFSIGLYKLKMDGSLDLLNGQPQLTYTQATIKEVARALSGWTYPTQPGLQPVSQNPDYFVGLMEPRPSHHDQGSKTIFGTTIPAGQTVTQDLESVIDIVFNHPNVAPFVATRLIRSLVTSNPSEGYISRVAHVFADNGDGVRGDMRAVVWAILTDAEASLPGATDGRLRDPILHVLGLARALGIQVANPGMFQYVMTTLGQRTLSAPTVFSFYSPLAPLPGNPTKFGPEFQIYTPALAIQRANFIYMILTNQFSSSFPVDLSPFTAVAGNPTALVELVNQRLLFGRMSNELRQVLVTLASSTSDHSQRALGTVYLTALSSEFMVHTGLLFLPN